MTIDHSQLLIGGVWTDPATGNRITVRSASTEEVIGSVPEASTADVDAAVAAARRPSTTRPAGPPGTPPAEPKSSSVSPRSTRTALGADLHRGLARRTACRSPSRASWRAFPPVLFRYYADLIRKQPAEEVRDGLSRQHRDRPAQPRRRRRRDRPVERPAVVDRHQAGPGPRRRLHDRGQAVSRDGARRATCSPRPLSQPASRRASSASFPAAVSSAPTSSPTPGSTRSPSPARPPAVAPSRRHVQRCCGRSRSNWVASPQRSSSTTLTSTWPRWGSPCSGRPSRTTGRSASSAPASSRPASRYDEVVDTFAALMNSANRRRQPRRDDPHRAHGQQCPAAIGSTATSSAASPTEPGSWSAALAVPTGSTAAGSSARRSSPTSTTTPRSPARRSSVRSCPSSRYTDDAEAIAIANDSDYGLGGSVWSTDPERATHGRERRADRHDRHQRLPPRPAGTVRRRQGQRYRQGVRARGLGRVPESQVGLPVRLTVFRVPRPRVVRALVAGRPSPSPPPVSGRT